MTTELSFGFPTEEKATTTINEFFDWDLDPNRNYIDDVAFLYDNVFDEDERIIYDIEYGFMIDSPKASFTLDDHESHGKTKQCKFCLIELSENILRDRQEF